ncbi:Citrate lyase subunit beta [Bienertia sinuspersici]
MEDRDKILERPFFDSKPVVKTIALHFKYWGIRALEKIIKAVGKLIRLDKTTTKREKLSYARVMVEVEYD